MSMLDSVILRSQNTHCSWNLKIMISVKQEDKRERYYIIEIYPTIYINKRKGQVRSFSWAIGDYSSFPRSLRQEAIGLNDQTE